MRIDAHQHFWSLERGDYHWLTPALDSLYRDFGPGDLQPLLARNGIAGRLRFKRPRPLPKPNICSRSPMFIRGFWVW